MQGVEDHQGDQLLRILARAVVVGAAADHRLGPVGVGVGGDEQVAGRLRRRVGRGRVERRGLGEGARLDRAVDLVGGDLEVAGEAELTGGVEQRPGADQVGAGEGVLIVDRAVDVGLGGEVDDRVAALHRLAHDRRVLDRSDDELDVVRQVLAAAGVGELVEDPHLVLLLRDPHVCRADESGGSRHKQLHAASFSLSRWARYPASPSCQDGSSIACSRWLSSAEYGGREPGGRASLSSPRAPCTRPWPARRSHGRARTGSRSRPPPCGGCRARAPRSGARSRRRGARCRSASRPGRGRRGPRSGSPPGAASSRRSCRRRSRRARTSGR